MTSNKSNRKVNISDSSLSEINTTSENTDKDASKSLESEEDFAVHCIEGNKFEFVVDISKHRVFVLDRVLSGKKSRYKVKSGWSGSLNEFFMGKIQIGLLMVFQTSRRSF